MKTTRILTLMAAIGVASALTGCTTFQVPFTKSFPKASASNPVSEIVCFWQPGEGHDMDNRPCKGFVGHVVFVSGKTGTPVEVQGTVRIYLFDDQGKTEKERIMPLKQYEFRSPEWERLLGESVLGPGYRVFVPYTRPGVNNANCALRVRLQPKYGGPVIFSDMANLPLTGSATSKPLLRNEEAKPFSDEELNQINIDAMKDELRRTTTISLGNNPKVSDRVADRPKAVNGSATEQPGESSNPIQQASHQIEAATPAKSSEAERIRLLEAKIQLLLQQQANQTPQQNSMRIKPPRRLNQATLDALDDETPVAPRRSLRRSNPLDDVDDDQDVPRSSSPTNKPASKHPLDDTEDEYSSTSGLPIDEEELALEPFIGDPFETVEVSFRSSQRIVR